MGKLKTNGLINTMKLTASKHSPEILMGIGIAGTITTTVLAVKSTPKAISLIDAEKARINRNLVHEAADQGLEQCDQISKLKPIEVVKVAWKCYIPAIVTGMLSVSCLIGASKVSLKRNAVLATAYKLSETALSEYKEAVIETIGEKKDKVIKDKIADNRMKNDPVTKKEVYVTGKGSTRCYDYHNGRYFDSDMETIRRAENNLNKEMLTSDYVSLNDLYDELGLDHTSMGEEFGWSIVDGMLEIDFSSCIADDGIPCLVINYNIAPKRNYWKYD